MPNPQLTIGMPVYNDVDFIEESLNSILNQTYGNFKLIISDDCSTDGSLNIIEQFAKKDSRIEVIRQTKNLGISKNMELLLEKAQTPYFMWAGDDDIMKETFVEKLMTALEQNSTYVAAFSTMQFIDEENLPVGEVIDYDYEHENTKKRLKNFIKDPFDGFGYGLFRTEAIRGVRFPIWVWPNKKVSWNNIYPTLCFYLAKGNYKHVYDEPLFLKRIKTKVNHSETPKNRFVEFFSFSIRRINLFFVSRKNIRKEYKMNIPLTMYMFKKWTIVPIYYSFIGMFSKRLETP